MGGFAWVTLATNDSYSLGALVLAHSLRRVGSQHDLAVLITPGVTQSMREKLATVFTLVREVNVLDSKDEANLAVLQRPELGITFTKLHCWRLTQYDKCVFIDADALVVRNCDELFEREELSAAPDVGWPDCFNSGVFVFKPSQQTFASLTAFAASQGSFDGADQGLLNMFFSDWAHKDISKHLPFIYNMCSTATYSYAPAFKQYGENVRIVHFIGATKPWLQYFDTLTGIVQPPPACNHLQPLLQIWWNIFCDNVHPQLTDVMAANNMTTIWHDSSSYPTYSDHTSSQQFSNQDTHCDNTSLPDFSEFTDPWDNYFECKDSFSQNVQQSDSGTQYYSDTNTHYSEPPQFVSHSQCGAELPPSSSTSSSREDINPQQDHYSLNYYVDHQTLQEENCSFGRETVQRIFEDHDDTCEDITDPQWISKQLSEIEALCNLIEQVNNVPEDHNHVTDDQNRHRLFIDEHHQNEHMAGTSSCGTQKSSRKNNYHDHKQTSTYIPSSSHSPPPCTDPNNVATQSELSASTCIENAEGGLAGALSKLTLGESRSDEQQAIEDHMRKQNWEQGYIDFMGRDSFDNILKKINETLASAPSRQPSPPKETRQPEKSDSKSSEVEAAVEESEAALPVLATEGLQAETGTTQGSLEEKCQRISSSEVAPSQIESSLITATSETDNTSGVNISDSTQQILESTEKLVPSLQSIDVPDTTAQSRSEIPLEPQAQAQITLDVKETEAIAPELAIETKVPQESKQVVETEPVIEKVAENVSEASIDIAISPSRPVESASEVSTVLSSVPSASVETKPVETSVQTQQATAQVVSEATTECPVPIQVAESVLQTVPKESVSEDPRPIVETVVSSIIPPVQESAAAVSETLIEPGRTAPADPIVHPQQLNGDDPSLQLEVERVFAPSVTSTALVSRSPNVVSVVHEFSPRVPQETPVAEVSENQQQAEQLPKQENNLSAPTPAEVSTSSVSEQDETPASQKSPLSVKLPQSETTEKFTDESLVLTSDPQKTTTSDPAEVLPTDSVLQEEGPLRPNRSKDLKIPSTPIVIEATPPSSPPLDEEALKAAQLEQAQKKAQPETEAQVQSETQIQAEVDSQSTKIQTETATEVKTEAQPESKAETQPKQQSEAQPEQQTEVQVEQQAVLDPIPQAGAQAEQQAEAKSEQQAESQQTTKKVVKKLVKKSSGESDSPSSPESEGPGKKVVKKVVKKVTKKPKEGEEAEGSSSAEKPKKVVKTVKKVAKTSSSTSLETDKTVPETPPPSASSEVPVPPKRKAKSTSSVKGADKKPAES